MEIRIDGTTLRFRATGDGEPLLLVHGFPLSGALWEPLAEPLAGEYRLIVPDLRGHGESEASDGVGMDRYAADLASILDHLGERRPVVLVGHSMGGYIAFEFSRRHAERVRALVLANTRASADTDEQAGTRRETAARVRREGSAVVADSMLGKLFSPHAGHALKERWHAVMAATPTRGVAAALEAMAARPASFDTLRDFARPVLVVAGEDDAIVPLDEARAMQSAAPIARLEIVAGAGHMTPVEQPARFIELLRDFLAGLPETAADEA